MKKLLLLIPFILLSSCYKDEIEANQLEILQLKQELNEVKSDIDRINELIVQNSIDVAVIKTRLDRVEDDIDDLGNFINELKKDVSELFASISFINSYVEDLDNRTQESFSQLLNDYRLLEYSLNYLLELQIYQNSLSTSQLESLLNDLQDFINYYNEYNTLDNLPISIIGHIKSKMLISGVSRVNFGEGAVPGTISADCNWVRIMSDSRDNLISALNPYNNTLLLTHHSDIINEQIEETPNDNLKLYKNFFGSPKNILYVSTRTPSEISIFISYMKSLGHSITHVTQPRNIYNTSDIPELSAENLDNFQGIIFDDNMLRPSVEIQNNLKNFFENPTKSSVVVSIGWVWTHYRANYTDEKYPLNNVIESMGAKFITWNQTSYAHDTYNFMNYYPTTYNQNSPTCN